MKHPTLNLTITDEQIERAIQSNSGGCLIADAIKSQYPQMSAVTVDMATIRMTDRKEGVRYTYLTPAAAQHVLLSFDQGWPNPTDRVVLRRPIHVGQLPAPGVSRREERAERRALLEAKEERGDELTPREVRSLREFRKHDAEPARPTTVGPVEVHLHRHGSVTVEGGRPPLQGPAHPNLLRGRNRHFGAKLADPGEAFRAAVEAEVAQRLAQDSEDD